MTYLLDVNVLLALVSKESEFHPRTEAWLASLSKERDALASCSITELGVLRIIPQISEGTYSVIETQKLIREVKAALKVKLLFISDSLGADDLPAWVRHPRQTTDGHLAALAKAHGAALATFDRKIPGAFLIPA